LTNASCETVKVAVTELPDINCPPSFLCSSNGGESALRP